MRHHHDDTAPLSPLSSGTGCVCCGTALISLNFVHSAISLIYFTFLRAQPVQPITLETCTLCGRTGRVTWRRQLFTGNSTKIIVNEMNYLAQHWSFFRVSRETLSHAQIWLILKKDWRRIFLLSKKSKLPKKWEFQFRGKMRQLEWGII